MYTVHIRPQLAPLIPAANMILHILDYARKNSGCVIAICNCENGHPLEVHTLQELPNWERDLYLIPHQAYSLKGKNELFSYNVTENPKKQGAVKLGEFAFVTLGLRPEHNALTSALLASFSSPISLNGYSEAYLEEICVGIKNLNQWDNYVRLRTKIQDEKILLLN